MRLREETTPIQIGSYIGNSLNEVGFYSVHPGYHEKDSNDGRITVEPCPYHYQGKNVIIIKQRAIRGRSVRRETIIIHEINN